MRPIKRIVGPTSFYQPTDIINQQFSIPSNIIHYIKKNPLTPKSYEKLLKLCKFFYSQKSFLVTVYDTQHYWPEGHSGWVTYPFRCHMNKFFDVKFKLENITFNLWLTFCFTVYFTKNENLASAFLQKVIKCDIETLHLEHQKLTFDEFKFMTPKVMDLHLKDTVICCDNDENILIDCIFECCPNIKAFFYERRKNLPGIFTHKAIQNLEKLVHSSPTLKHFGLARVPRDFDVDTILNLFTSRPKIEYYLDFRGPLLRAKTKKVKACVKNILQNGLTEYPIPVIFYSSQKAKERKAICELFKKSINELKMEKYFYYLLHDT